MWLDLGSRETIDEGCDALGDEIRRIDVLVNNAGAFTAGQLETQDVGDLDDLFQVNLVGLAHLTRRVLPAMLERGSGKIVNHSSLVAYFRFPGISTYSASKAGVAAFTDSLRRELRGTGVTTLEIVTGGVDTEMLDHAAGRLRGQADPSGWQWMAPVGMGQAHRGRDRVGQAHPAAARQEPAWQGALAGAPAFVLDAVSAKGIRTTVIALLWLTRDLRVHDHPALRAALDSGGATSRCSVSTIGCCGTPCVGSADPVHARVLRRPRRAAPPGGWSCAAGRRNAGWSASPAKPRRPRCTSAPTRARSRGGGRARARALRAGAATPHAQAGPARRRRP